MYFGKADSSLLSSKSNFNHGGQIWLERVRLDPQKVCLRSCSSVKSGQVHVIGWDGERDKRNNKERDKLVWDDRPTWRTARTCPDLLIIIPYMG